MPAFYAAVQAVADGQVGEVEIDHRVTDEEAHREEVLTVVVRRKIRPLMDNSGDQPEPG